MTLTYTPGINDHDLMWSSPAQQAQAIADMVALGVKVHRCDLYITDLTDPTKVVQTTQTFIGWVGLLKAAGIQPFPVITWNDPNAAQTLPDGRVAGAALATLAKQVPGVWWEYGNEVEYMTETLNITADLVDLMGRKPAVQITRTEPR